MSDRQDRALAATGAACAALVFAVVASSAWLRLAPAVPCPGGACEGFSLADGVRLAHRVAAMGVSVAALLAAWLAWARRPVSPGLRTLAIGIVVLVAFLAVLGRSSAGAPTAPVALGNLLGGLLLLGACTALASAGALARPSRGGAAHGPTLATAGLTLAALVTGALLAVLPPGAGPPASLHAVAGWLLAIAWAWLAGRPGAGPARGACAVTALAVIGATALATLGPPRSATPLGAWLHNGLAAAALCGALVAVSRSRPPT